MADPPLASNGSNLLRFPPGDRFTALELPPDATVEDAVKALARSERRFRSLVEATSQMVWTATPAGEVVQDSPSWRAFTGQSYDE
jgi:PAS domain-containing protein